MIRPCLIVVTGPTAVGKTDVAVDIAQWAGAEIISADSRQIYREMAIGTAVPDHVQLAGVKHHFIQTHSIHEYYNASKFEEQALETLSRLFVNNRLSVMTGGSMLYIDAVCKGIDDLPAVDPAIRKTLIEKFYDQGIESLRFELKRLDPDYYGQVDLKNHKRLLHALEICLMTGKPYSAFRTNRVKRRPFDILKIGLNMDRGQLYERINRRVDLMVEAGLEEEARRLYPWRHCNALSTVGYREWFDFFDGKVTRELAIEQIKSNTRRYARKQLTWFKRDPDVHWFDPGNTDLIKAFIENKIQQNE